LLLSLPKIGRTSCARPCPVVFTCCSHSPRCRARNLRPG